MEHLAQSKQLGHPVHHDLLELCTCGRADPVEAGVGDARGVEIGNHRFEGADTWKIRHELAVLPVGDAGEDEGFEVGLDEGKVFTSLWRLACSVRG